jgi:hypothetical protein
MSSFQYFIQFGLIQAITYCKHNYNRPLVCAFLLICIIYAYLRCRRIVSDKFAVVQVRNWGQRVWIGSIHTFQIRFGILRVGGVARAQIWVIMFRICN